MTPEAHQTLLRICAQLDEQGIEPSIARIKARLSSPLPMPVIIKALRAYQAGERGKPEGLPNTDKAAPQANRGTIEGLERRIDALEAQVAELQALIGHKVGTRTQTGEK